MKTIGVLGGIGPQATLDFEARIHIVSQRLIPQRWGSGYPPMLVYYFRHAPVVLGDDFRPVFPVQPDPRLLDAAKRLGGWVDFLVITANAPHMFHEQIERAAGRPLLSMIQVTLEEVKRREWKKVGVLGLGEPIVYKVPLGQLGLACETIAGDLRDQLDQAIGALDEGRAGPGARMVAREAVSALRGRQVDGIILGCTEIPLLLNQELDDPFLINPIQLLAEAAVRRAMD